jgi:hypothetical protein
MSAGKKSPLGSEFDNFLFAPIGEDQNGLILRVVSLLARMNLDPWEEAGNLASLPAQAAGRRLALSLDSMTDPSLRQAASETMVLRLLALLPRRATAAVAMPHTRVDAIVAPDAGIRLRTLVFIASAIVLLGAQIIAAHRFAPAQPGLATGPAVLTVPSQPLPIARGH